MIKLIAIDLDGTMYTTARNITRPVREALKIALDTGIEIVIVTGRARRGAENALDTLGMDLPFICSAGALICSGINGKTIHAWTFHNHEELTHVIDYSRKNGTGLIGEPLSGNNYWFGQDNLNDIMDPLTAREAQLSIRSFEPEKDFDQPLLKVTIVAKPQQLGELENIIQRDCPGLHQVYSGNHYIDLTADGVNKGTALKAIAEFKGINREEISAIGDQEIDLHMLNYSGFPVAMSNAVPVLKSVAKWIAPSNEEDGVAATIHKILELNSRTL